MGDVDNPHTYPQPRASSGQGDPLHVLRCAGMGTCKAYRCTTDTNEVLCREHAKRLHDGGGLPTAAETFPGDPSGHGIYSQLEQTEFGAICHECGHPFISIAVHTSRTHQLSAAEYRRRHGIPRHIPLVADQVSANRASDTPSALRRRLPCRRCGPTTPSKAGSAIPANRTSRPWRPNGHADARSHPTNRSRSGKRSAPTNWPT